MIPIILLGEKRDRKICDTLYQLSENCGKIQGSDFCWNADAKFLLIDSPQVDYLDAGGGIVILKESFLKRHRPAHLLHATCVFLSECREAAEFAAECGLPSVACGGSFDPLSFSSMKDQMVLSLQKGIRRLDGSEVTEGDFPVSIPKSNELSINEMLFCAATLLLLGQL